MQTATLRYNYSTASWEAVADWDKSLVGSGTTPEEAVDNLKYDWKEGKRWNQSAT